MKFSIVTATYNSEGTLKDTLDSVYNQTFKDSEHLIIDGVSKDRTLQICEEHISKPRVVSEQDKGLYDAMNKGIRLSEGEIVGILNSDDFYFDDRVLEKVNDAFEKEKADVVYGNIVYVNQDNISKSSRFWRPSKVRRWKLWLGWTIPHPAVFVRKGVYEKIGLFDLAFRVAADYDLLLRIMLDRQVRMAHLNETLVSMRTGGVSDAGWKGRARGLHQVCLSFKKNVGIYPFWFFLTRPLIKLHQLF